MKEAGRSCLHRIYSRSKSLNRQSLLNLGLVAVVLALGSLITARVACADPTNAPRAASSPKAAPAPIEPEVRRVLEGACAALSSAQRVSYHAEITFDSVLPSLVKLQYAGAMDVAIERPDNLSVDYQSDLGAKRIWYNGQTLIIFDPAHLVYASVEAPGSIDTMIGDIAKNKNLSIPLAGFDVSDPCARATRDVLRSKYVGLNDVAGIECDHLAFFQEQVDWQLWVEHGKNPVARKIVITYKKLPTQPQWEAVFSKWRFDPPLAAGIFEPKIPKDAVKAQFLEFKGGTQ